MKDCRPRVDRPEKSKRVFSLNEFMYFCSALPERTFHAAGQLSFKRKGIEDIFLVLIEKCREWTLSKKENHIIKSKQKGLLSSGHVHWQINYKDKVLLNEQTDQTTWHK